MAYLHDSINGARGTMVEMSIVWQKNVSLAKYSYFQIGAVVASLAIVDDEASLVDLLNELLEKKTPYYLFGGMTNTLFAKDNFEGVVILYRGGEIKIEGDLLTAQAGASMAKAAAASIKNNLGGLAEFMSLPGSVGGAIFGNSHFGTLSVSDFLQEVVVFDLEERAIKTLARTDLDFSYDNSSFQKSPGVILRAAWKLPGVPSAELLELSKQATQKRAASQPLELASLGCFWQNPVINNERVSAGKLIDQAGLKGLKCGGVEVSDKHAAFIVKKDVATPQNVLELAASIKKAVKDVHGIDLIPEVKVIS